MRENDIVFLNLHRRYRGHVPSFGGFIGIYLLAAFVNENGFSGQAFQGTLHEGKELLDELCRAKKVHSVGLYCDYANLTENAYLSRYIRETYGLPVFVGGPQATLLSADFYQQAQCQAVVRGEGELTVLALLDCVLDGTGRLEDIAGISYWADGKLHITPPRPPIMNLDALPFIDDDCYLRPRRNPYELSLLTGRGCLFACAFCHEGSHTRNVRFRSPENVLAEIDAYIAAHPEEDELYLLFVDDTFTLNSERLQKICAGLKERAQKVHLRWFCEGHIHTLYTHPEMLDMLADAGLQRLQLGIEAGTQEVLTAYGKHTTPDEIREVLRHARDAGIPQIFGNIIVGGAHFTREIWAQDLAFAKEILTLGRGTLELGVIPYWPLGGTAMTLHPEKFGLHITDYDFATSVEDFPQTKTDELSTFEVFHLWQEMQRGISQHMESMLRNRVVPPAQVLSFYQRENRHKYYGFWWQTLSRLPALLSYYGMLVIGEAETMQDYQGTIEAMRPMRVLPLMEYMEVHDKEQAEIDGVKLSPLERDLLIYATGRFSLAWIWKKLAMKYKDKTMSDAVKALQKLEAAFLVVLAKE